VAHVRLMLEGEARLGAWRIARTLGRDRSGTYYTGCRGDGERATLYLLAADQVHVRGEALSQLLELHQRISHRGLLGFRGFERDGSDVFLIGDPVDDAMMSLRSALRPAAGQVRPLGAALAGALVAAHDGGLVHGGLELDNVLWARDRAPQILGTGVAALGIADRTALAQGDVVSLGRLMCALVVSQPGQLDGADRAIELVSVLADPAMRLSMREAHALLAAGVPTQPLPEGGTAGVAEPPTVNLRPRAYARDSRSDGITTGATSDPISSEDGAATGPARKLGCLGGHLGRYRILSRLGCGGMGEVLLAEDPALCRGVAIKHIRPGLERDRTFRARLRREAQLAARLSHRAIVQVFDLITDDDGDHVIMEYVPGPSLHTLVAGRPMAVSQVVHIATELADGLAYAHQQGIVHRDLKIENILIGIDGQPKIADFGIARGTAPIVDAHGQDAATGDGCVLGTSRAMSPEQIQGHDVDARSDLFSFGVMLYELITGVSPFAAGVETVTLLRVLHDRPLPVHALVADVPRALSDLIDHLLEKVPARRPDSARAVRDRLRRVLDASPVARAAPVDAPAADALPNIEPAPLDSWQTAGRRDTRGPRTGVRHSMLATDRKASTSKIQAPFVLAEIRALRSSVFKKSPEIQSALAIADKVEHAYDLQRTDLFVPALDTFCAILQPLVATLLTGTLRRIGYEIFPEWVSILGLQRSDVRTAMKLRTGADLVRVICEAYSKCVIGIDAGTLVPRASGSTLTVTDTTILPCQLQMGVFLGAGRLTELFHDSVLTEKRCRSRGDNVCTYELAF